MLSISRTNSDALLNVDMYQPKTKDSVTGEVVFVKPDSPDSRIDGIVGAGAGASDSGSGDKSEEEDSTAI